MYEFKCSVTRVVLRLKQNGADKEAASVTVESAFKVRSTTVAAWREGKRRTVARIEAASCS